MGGKRTWAGQCLYLCIAGLILLGPACAHMRPDPAGPEQCSRLRHLQPLIDRGEFDGAVRASEEVLASPAAGTQGDQALFALGLVSADARNPRKDYRKSREYFNRLVREFPGSGLAGEARIWIGVLDLFEKTKQLDLEIEGMKKEIGK